MDHNMNLGNSSPERPSIFINYLDPAPPVAAEQSFLDISIKDEPLDITDNGPSEDSTEAHSKNDTEQDQAYSKNDTEQEEVYSKNDTEQEEAYSKNDTEQDDAYSKNDTEQEEVYSKNDTEQEEAYSKNDTEQDDAYSKNDTEQEEAYSKNDTIQDDTSLHKESFTVEALTNADSIYEGIMQCDSDTDFSDVDGQELDDQINPQRGGPFEDSLLLDDNTFSCSICSFTTDKQGRLKDHERNHRKTNMPIFQCIYCSQRYTRNLLYLHVLNVHPGQKFQIRDVMPNEASTPSHKCSRCSYSTKYRENLTLHMKKHYFKIGNSIDKSPFDDKTNTPSNPKQAEFIATPNKSPTVKQVLQCSFCAFSTSEQGTFTLHKKEHFRPIEGKDATGRTRVDCKICSYSCGNIHSMNEHIDSHKNNRPIKQCANCDYKSTPIALSWHVKKCRNNFRSASNADPDGTCKRIRIDQALVKSSKEIVTVKTSLKCKTCSFSTKDKLKFKLHANKHLFEPVKRANASGPTMYHCKMCSFFCETLKGMVAHINSHKRNLPIIKCTNCEFKSTPRAVKFHKRNCNLGIVKDVPDEVQNSVKSSGSNKAPAATRFQGSTRTLSTTEESKLQRKLKKHLFVPAKRIAASGRAIYHCKMCSYSSTKLVAVLSHLNLHKHNLPIIKCTNCDYKSTSRAIKFHQQNCTLGNVIDASQEVQNSIKGSDFNESSSTTHFQCPTCTFSTTDEPKFKLHTNKHLFEPEILVDSSGLQIYKCRMCSYFSGRTTQIIGHINTHKSNLPIVNCSYCDFQSTPRAVKFHQRYCKGNAESVTQGTIKDVSSEVRTDRHTRNFSDSDNISSKATFQCSICTFSTTDQLRLKTHTNKHRFEPDIITDSSGFKMYQCRMCSLSTKKSHAIINHINSHRNNFPIVSCSYCDFKSTVRAVKFHSHSCSFRPPPKENVQNLSEKVTVDKKLIKSHFSKVSPKTLFKCSICTFSSTEKLRLNIHMKNHRFEPEVSGSSGLKIHQCDLCSYTTTQASRIIPHLKTHENNSPLVECSNCDFKSTSRAAKFHSHSCSLKSPTKGNVQNLSEKVTVDKNLIKSSHSSKVSSKTLFKCSICTFSSSGKLRLNIHMQNHRFEPEVSDSASLKIHQCEKCSYTTNKADRIIPHLKTHEDNSLIECSNCDFKSTSRAVKFHMRLSCKASSNSARVKDTKHVSISTDMCGREVYQCKLCSYESKQLRYMTLHINLHKRNLPIISCPNCYTYKSTQKAVRYHLLKCRADKPVGGKTFESKYPFACPTCSFSTPLRRKLKLHIKKNHSDTENKFISENLPTSVENSTATSENLTTNFKCKFCTFTTDTIHGYNNHMRTHASKVFKCNLCSYTGSRIGSYKHHMITHKMNQPINKCYRCNFKGTPRLLRRHIFIEKHGNKYTCKVCLAIYPDSLKLKRHMTSHQLTKPVKKCPDCSFTSTKSDLLQHNCGKDQPKKAKKDAISNDDSKDVQIKVDDFSYKKNKQKVETGRKSNSSLKKSLFRCAQCSFVTCLRIKLNIHTKKYHKKLISKRSTKSRTIHKCGDCSYFTPNVGHLRRHVRTQHLRPKRLTIKKCKKCDFRSIMHELRIHSRKCHGDLSKGAESSNDGAVTNQSGLIKVGRNDYMLENTAVMSQGLRTGIDNSIEDTNDISASTSQRLECCLCSFTSFHKGNLKLHVEGVHSRQLTTQDMFKDVYQCRICDFTTLFKAKMGDHRENTKHNTTNYLETNRSSLPDKESVDDIFRYRGSSKDRDDQNNIAIVLDTESWTNSADQTVYKCASYGFSSVYKGNWKRHVDTHVEKTVESGPDQSAAESTKQCIDKNKSYRSNRDNVSNIAEVNQNQAKVSIATDTETIFMTSPGVYACSICSYTSKVKTSVRDHQNGAHRENIPIRQCPNSNCTYRSTPKALSLHVLKCSDSNESNSDLSSTSTKDLEVYKCGLCSYTSTVKGALTRHFSTHMIKRQPVKQCAKCDFKGTPNLLETHGPICPNKGKPKQLLKCSECSYSSVSAKILKNHEANVHLKKEIKTSTCPKSFKCEFCSFTSFWEYLIERHMNSHTLLKLPIEQCNKCDFRSTPSALAAHMNTCTKKSSVLSDVSANNLLSKKLIAHTNNDLDYSSQNDSDTVKKHADRKKVQDNDYDKISEVRLNSSDDELTRKSPSSSEILSSNMEVYVNDQEEDEVNIQKESKIVNILAMANYSAPKTAFNCPKCSFSTQLRIKLKVHIEKTHMDD